MMDTQTADLTRREYRRERLRWGRSSLLISLLALILSAWSFFETTLRQPNFAAYTAPDWQYGRGPGTDDEFLIVPLTIANHGARPGAVLFIELTLKNTTGEERSFLSSAVLQDEKNRLLFAPLSVQGHMAVSSAIVFTPPAEGEAAIARAFIDGNGRYQARLTFCTAFNRAFGQFDSLLTLQPADLAVELNMRSFRLERLLAGNNEKIGATAFAASPRKDGACASTGTL
jgi:hypothetical protein